MSAQALQWDRTADAITRYVSPTTLTTDDQRLIRRATAGIHHADQEMAGKARGLVS